jgi:hypothetical protein
MRERFSAAWQDRAESSAIGSALTHFRTLKLHSAFTSCTSFSMDFFASPKSISVLGL